MLWLRAYHAISRTSPASLTASRCADWCRLVQTGEVSPLKQCLFSLACSSVAETDKHILSINSQAQECTKYHHPIFLAVSLLTSSFELRHSLVGPLTLC